MLVLAREATVSSRERRLPEGHGLVHSIRQGAIALLDLILVLFALAVLLLAVGLLQPLATRLALPQTLVLAVLGAVLGVVFGPWQPLGDLEALADLHGGLSLLDLSAEAFLFIFLPPLLFTAGLSVDVRLLKEDLAAVLLLAVVAVFICVLVVGLALWPLVGAGLSLVACLLLGAVVGPTDPAAVVGVFRDIGAPRRLTTLVAGESLFNDAAAIVLFSLFVSVLSLGGSLSVFSTLETLVVAFLGGSVFGVLAGKLAGLAFRWVAHSAVAATSVSVALAYLVYILGERYIGVSGVVAVVAAALVFTVDGPTHLIPTVWQSVKTAWQQLEFWANSLVFVLASMLAVMALPAAAPGELLLVLVVVAAALLARTLVLYLLLPLIVGLGLTRPIGERFKVVIIWGGLRGAVTMVLALAVAGDSSLPQEVRDLVALLAIGYTFFTVLVQASTLKPVLRLLGLDRLPAREQQLRDRVMALSVEEVSRQVLEAARNYDLAPELVEATVARERPKVEESSMSREDSLAVGLLTLVTRERDLYLRHLHEQVLGRRLVAGLITSTDRLRDAVRDEGLAGWHKATGWVLGFALPQRLALWVLRRFGWRRPLALTLADRFELLMITRFVVSELKTYAEERLAPVMVPEARDDLIAALVQRQSDLDSALAAAHTRYPSYSDALAARYLARIALRLEAAAFERQLQEQLISREVHADLLRGQEARRARLSRRPSLDLGLELASMIDRVPLFHRLPEASQQRLAEALRPGLALPGEAIVTKGAAGRSLYFVVAGEVVVELPTGGIRLGPGAFFGELALLSRSARTATVRAEGYCHLLLLDAGDFREALRRDPALREHIESVAASRRTRPKDTPAAEG
ncbi:MAG: cation:proton antiporter [Rhodospirillales bacterium]